MSQSHYHGAGANGAVSGASKNPSFRQRRESTPQPAQNIKPQRGKKFATGGIITPPEKTYLIGETPHAFPEYVWKCMEERALKNTRPGTAARAAEIFSMLGCTLVNVVQHRARMSQRPRLNPVLLALHMQSAKHPPPRIIDTSNDF